MLKYYFSVKSQKELTDAFIMIKGETENRKEMFSNAVLLFEKYKTIYFSSGILTYLYLTSENSLEEMKVRLAIENNFRVKEIKAAEQSISVIKKLYLVIEEQERKLKKILGRLYDEIPLPEKRKYNDAQNIFFNDKVEVDPGLSANGVADQEIPYPIDYLRGEEMDYSKLNVEEMVNNLALLFVPAGVGLMVHYRLIAADGLVIATALVLSTAVTLLVTGVLLNKLAAKHIESADQATEEKEHG